MESRPFLFAGRKKRARTAQEPVIESILCVCVRGPKIIADGIKSAAPAYIRPAKAFQVSLAFLLSFFFPLFVALVLLRLPRLCAIGRRHQKVHHHREMC